MFSYVFMKILEGRPRSYDKRINRVSKGRIRTIKEDVAAKVPPDSEVLEIGCGTGELAGMLISRGSMVDGFDISPSMVEAAHERIKTEGIGERFKVRKMGVDGMDSLPDRAYDVVISTLVFSELTDDERRFALKHAHRVLRFDGRLVIADEVLPRSRGRRALYTMVRLPMLAFTYLISGSSTRPVPDLAGEISDAGFKLEKEIRSHGDAFAIVVANFSAEHIIV